jgi:hypothetical protein
VLKVSLFFAFIAAVGYFYGLNRYYNVTHVPARSGEIKIKSEMTKQQVSALWIAKATPEKKIK